GRLLKDSKYWLTKSDVGEGVYISASDIRKLQLAKAAIAAGVEVLLHFASVKMSDVKTLALAGGFGCHMDLQSATRIGLINKALQSIAVSYGNTAGDGAQIALRSEVARLKLDSFQKKCEYINLSATTLFNEKFYDNMGF
ncbi:MAG: ATP-binding protein, partial [Oscillospiraceae bacterium]|nr:ATP-binding protein [Oscillospiraceae bacterium]